MSEIYSLIPRDMLVVIDVQNDFVSGSVAIPGAPEIIPVINRLSALFDQVVFTQDWHPLEHISFASRHEARPGDVIQASYGKQALFADHCVRGEAGAELDAGLDLSRTVLRLYKGHRANIDSFSAFTENDRMTTTGLEGYLRALEVRRVFFVGLSLYGCVRHSALDAVRAKFNASVVVDACRARPSEMDSQHEQELRQSGVAMISSAQLVRKR